MGPLPYTYFCLVSDCPMVGYPLPYQADFILTYYVPVPGEYWNWNIRYMLGGVVRGEG